MKKYKNLLSILLFLLILLQPIGVEAKGFSSGGFHSSPSRPSTSTAKPSAPKATAPKSSTSTPKATAPSSSKAGEGFKSGSYSSTASPKKSVDTSSPALKSIPKEQSSNSVSNNYYYIHHDYDSGMSNFWSNYWLYRAITPDNRTYVVNGTPTVAPAYTGVSSILPDIFTFIFIAALLGVGIYFSRHWWVRLWRKIRHKINWRNRW